MTSATQAKTIAELRASNYQVVPVREEMRNNLITQIRAEQIVFPSKRPNTPILSGTRSKGDKAYRTASGTKARSGRATRLSKVNRHTSRRNRMAWGKTRGAK